MSATKGQRAKPVVAEDRKGHPWKVYPSGRLLCVATGPPHRALLEDGTCDCLKREGETIATYTFPRFGRVGKSRGAIVSEDATLMIPEPDKTMSATDNDDRATRKRVREQVQTWDVSMIRWAMADVDYNSALGTVLRDEMISRGIGDRGEWVGFERASDFWRA
jgi:hypothetical protein